MKRFNYEGHEEVQKSNTLTSLRGCCEAFPKQSPTLREIAHLHLRQVQVSPPGTRLATTVKFMFLNSDTPGH